MVAAKQEARKLVNTVSESFHLLLQYKVKNLKSQMKKDFNQLLGLLRSKKEKRGRKPENWRSINSKRCPAPIDLRFLHAKVRFELC